MKIAMVSREFPPHRQASGIATYTHKTSRALAAAGHEVHVIAEAHRHATEDQMHDGVMVHRLRDPKMRPREARYVRRSFDVYRALNRYGPFDIVQACEWEGEAAVYARFRRTPLITRLATPLYIVEGLNQATQRERRRSLVVRSLERWQTHLSDIVICPSQSLASMVATDWGLDRSRLRIVPTGIELPLPGADGPLPEGAPDGPYILYFGRLEVRKGVQTLLDALPDVLRRHPQLHAVFVGDDLKLHGVPFADYGRARAGDMAERLVFLRRLQQASLFPLIRNATLVVLPSRWESLANACLEAMALGRPVIATRGSGFAEVIDHDVNGWLVPPDDSSALSASMSGALANPGRLAAVGAAAERKAAEYRLDRTVQHLLDVYQDVASGGSSLLSRASAT